MNFYVCLQGPDGGRLRADSIELENDVLPSTPLTEEQQGLEEVLGVPINQVSVHYAGYFLHVVEDTVEILNIRLIKILKYWLSIVQSLNGSV